MPTTLVTRLPQALLLLIAASACNGLGRASLETDCHAWFPLDVEGAYWDYDHPDDGEYANRAIGQDGDGLWGLDQDRLNDQDYYVRGSYYSCDGGLYLHYYDGPGSETEYSEPIPYLPESPAVGDEWSASYGYTSLSSGPSGTTRTEVSPRERHWSVIAEEEIEVEAGTFQALVVERYDSDMDLTLGFHPC